MSRRREYRVWSPDLGEERATAHIVEAESREDAVKGWAFRRDFETNEHDIVLGRIVPVCLVVNRDGKVTRHQVKGEPRPEYTVTMVGG